MKSEQSERNSSHTKIYENISWTSEREALEENKFAEPSTYSGGRIMRTEQNSLVESWVLSLQFPLKRFQFYAEHVPPPQPLIYNFLYSTFFFLAPLKLREIPMKMRKSLSVQQHNHHHASSGIVSVSMHHWKNWGFRKGESSLPPAEFHSFWFGMSHMSTCAAQWQKKMG